VKKKYERGGQMKINVQVYGDNTSTAAILMNQDFKCGDGVKF
jgi:hypothetical protein